MQSATHAEAPAPAASGLDRLRRADFARLATFIEGYAGIKMPESKVTMLEGRLHKRVRATGKSSLAAYCRFLFDEHGLQDEVVHLIDAVSTNKTDFFREPEQFRVLQQVALPELLRGRAAGARPIKVWCTASSIGAEPYTLAMVLAEFARERATQPASVLATDINTEVLAAAHRAIYAEELVEPVPDALRRRYLMRSRDRSRALVRVVPELRRMVTFRRLNLMDERYDVDAEFDVIFCRNVLIYFQRDIQAAVLGRLCGLLRPGGYLFIGHSESITGMGLPLAALGHNVFRRT